MSFENRPVDPAERDRAERDLMTFEEIDLYGELLIAAGSTDRPLSEDEIDRALGLHAA